MTIFQYLDSIRGTSDLCYQFSVPPSTLKLRPTHTSAVLTSPTPRCGVGIVTSQTSKESMYRHTTDPGFVRSERRRREDRGAEDAPPRGWGGKRCPLPTGRGMILDLKISTSIAFWALFCSSATCCTRKNTTFGLENLLLHANRQQKGAKQACWKR